MSDSHWLRREGRGGNEAESVSRLDCYGEQGRRGNEVADSRQLREVQGSVQWENELCNAGGNGEPGKRNTENRM